MHGKSGGAYFFSRLRHEAPHLARGALRAEVSEAVALRTAAAQRVTSESGGAYLGMLTRSVADPFFSSSHENGDFSSS